MKRIHRAFWEESYKGLIQQCSSTLLILSPLDINGLDSSPLTNAQTLYDIYCTVTGVSRDQGRGLFSLQAGSDANVDEHTHIQEMDRMNLHIAMTESDMEVFSKSILPNFDACSQLLSRITIPSSSSKHTKRETEQEDTSYGNTSMTRLGGGGGGGGGGSVGMDSDEVDFSTTAARIVPAALHVHGDRSREEGLFSVIDGVGDEAMTRQVADALIVWMISYLENLTSPVPHRGDTGHKAQKRPTPEVQSKHALKRQHQMKVTIARLYQLLENYPLADLHYKESLQLIEAMHGSLDDPCTLPILLQWGDMLVMAGRQEEAEKALTQCLTLGRAYHNRSKQKDLSSSPPAKGHSPSKHGLSSPGKQNAATQRLEIEAYESVLQALSTLGALYYDRGKYKEALSLYEESVERMKEKFGLWNIITLGALHNLAVLCTKLSDYSSAEPLFIQCLDIKNKLLGTDHASTLNTLSLLADLYFSTGAYDEAEDHYRECATIQRAQLGAQHVSHLLTSHNLAVLLCKKDKLDEAAELLEECLVLMKESKSVGPKHCRTFTCALWLATVYSKQQKLYAAKKHMIECVEGRIEVLGRHHPDTITAANNLAGLYKRIGNWLMARDVYVQCFNTVEQKIATMKGSSKEEGKNGEGKEDALEDSPPFAESKHVGPLPGIATDEERAFGSIAITTMVNLAMLYCTIGQFTKAESLYYHCRKYARRVLDAEDARLEEIDADFKRVLYDKRNVLRNDNMTKYRIRI